MTDRERTAVQLREDFPALVAAKILDEKAVAGLEAYYPLPFKADYRRRMLLYFGLLSALLLGGGLVMIVAHNWEKLSLGGRLAVAYLPLFCFLGLGGWVLARRAASAVWREVVAVLILGALSSGIGIVSQQYHSTGTLAELTVVLMLFAAALVYMFRSSAALLLYSAGYCVVLSETYPFRIHAFYLLLVLLLPVLPKIVRMLRYHPWGLSAQACRTALTLMLACLVIRADKAETFQWYLWAVMSACLLRFGLLSARVSRFNPFLLVGLSGLLIECSVLSFYDVWRHLPSAGTGSLSAVGVTACAAATLFYSGVGFVSIMKDDKFVVWMPLVFPLPVLGGVWFGGNGAVCWIFNIYMAFCGIYLLGRGVRRRKMWFVNFGMGVLLLQILLRVSESNINYLYTGIVFIVAGLLFCGVNFYCVRYFFRQKKEGAL